MVRCWIDEANARGFCLLRISGSLSSSATRPLSDLLCVRDFRLTTRSVLDGRQSLRHRIRPIYTESLSAKPCCWVDESAAKKCAFAFPTRKKLPNHRLDRWRKPKVCTPRANLMDLLHERVFLPAIASDHQFHLTVSVLRSKTDTTFPVMVEVSVNNV